MRYHVVIPESVYLELQEISIYYESKQKGLGLKFIISWETAMQHLGEAPLLYQKKQKSLRTIRLTRFPYILVFEIIKQKIYIYRLIHAQRQTKKIFRS